MCEMTERERERHTHRERCFLAGLMIQWKSLFSSGHSNLKGPFLKHSNEVLSSIRSLPKIAPHCSRFACDSMKYWQSVSLIEAVCVCLWCECVSGDMETVPQ